ncbi:histidine kinase N-terminal 7TM domain-containing diguanylate cyclase [Motilibacter deserti]|uniref:Diguanylate cyclase n=1 Tax=Motilibacter deserti TaxID=2714956 RepID=A0ABX0GW95_9ACTN|nr:diguanylate cyclase [Motilibacter deserti]NHC14798.1 diguanylate cyclase [Motilibacter deserti]
MAGLDLLVVYALAGVFAVGTAVLSWRKRTASSAAPALSLTMSGVAVWCAADAVLFLGLPLSAQRVAASTAMVAIAVALGGMLRLSKAVVVPQWRPGDAHSVLLAGVPLLVAAAVATDAWHGRFFARPALTGPGGSLEYGYGPLAIAFFAWCYVIVVVFVWRWVRHWWRTPRVFRRQLSCLLLGAAVPAVGGAVQLLMTGTDGRSIDYTPALLVVTGLVDGWALFREGLFKIVPVARDLVVESMTEAVAVLGPDGRVVDVNPEGRSLAQRLRPFDGELLGADALETPLALLLPRQLAEEELREPEPGLFVHVQLRTLRDERDRLIGRLLVARDVSRYVHAARELERMNAELVEKVATIEALRRELQEEAVRDPLTGLHNRRFLMQTMDALDARPASADLSVIALDVDHFKQVNDTYGHDVGDQVLCAVSAFLWRAASGVHALTRIGGEEFVLVVAGSGLGQARDLAERLVRGVEELAVTVAGQRMPVTVSAGVASGRVPGVLTRELLRAADAAMYAAKRAGRNRVQAAGAAPAPLHIG